MSKIDTSTIEGYADMSADEKIAALEAFDVNDNSDELNKYKNATSKANSEAAEYKRQLKAAQEQIAQAEAAAQEGKSETDKEVEALKKQLAAMQHDKTVSDYTARFTSNGFDGELSAKAANALVDGDADSFFEQLTAFITAHDKALKAELAQHSIAPKAGNTNPDNKTPMTKKKLNAMSALEKMTWLSTHPDEAKELQA